jgi:hypothetical protein
MDDHQVHPAENVRGRPDREARPTALDGGSSADLRDAAEDAAASIEQLYHVSDAFLGRHATDRPYAILGTAFGVGFVLGGGLASRIGGVLVNALGRMLLNQAIDTWMTTSVGVIADAGERGGAHADA